MFKRKERREIWKKETEGGGGIGQTSLSVSIIQKGNCSVKFLSEKRGKAVLKKTSGGTQKTVAITFGNIWLGGKAMSFHEPVRRRRGRRKKKKKKGSGERKEGGRREGKRER